MNKLLNGFIKIEKSIQILSLVAVMLLLGYLATTQRGSDRVPAPAISPTTQNQ